MLSVKKNKQVHLHQLEDINYLLLNSWNANVEQIIHHYDAVLITTNTIEEFEELVLKLRTNPSNSVFLKPIFYKFEIKSSYTAHTDGLFQGLLSNTDTKQIQKKITELKELKATTTEQQRALQILQYMFTRSGKIQPIKSRAAKISYLFPFADLFFLGDEFDVISILQSMNRQKLVETKLRDRIQLCHDCHDGFVVFKETCPKCSSIDIQAFDVIHHFKCAHVAPETAYKNDENDDLVCPKCDKHLRHIGIDYDKPSSVYHCNQCDHDFQNAQIVAECHACDKKNSFEELIEININDYRLTMKGMELAQRGTFREDTESSVSHETIFNELVKHETARSKKTGTPSYLIDVNIKAPFFAMLNQQYKEQYWSEMKTIVKDYVLFESHIIVKKDNLKFLLLDQNEKETIATCERLKYNLNILLEDNLGGNIKVDVTHQNLA